MEVLLVSIGTCFAHSCWAAFANRGLERVGFEVSVTGRKAPQAPSRLAYIEVKVTFDASLPQADALGKLCTGGHQCSREWWLSLAGSRYRKAWRVAESLL